MKLRNIEYGNILGGSSVQGFWGDESEYLHHRLPNIPLLKNIKPDFTGMTFVTKTTTLHARDGNMPLNDTQQPKELLPKCIHIEYAKSAVLNAVGLSGPGISPLLSDGRWQKRKEPFFISFMSVAPSKAERLAEIRGFARKIICASYSFQAPTGLQINFSCPNTNIDPTELIGEVSEALDILCELNIPLMIKFSVAQVSAIIGTELAQHGACDAVCISNTIPWANLPDEVKLDTFGTTTSPLKKFGGGGYSGPYILPLVEQWIKDARNAGMTKPINAGGGIQSTHDVRRLYDAGAASVFIASVAMLRPWRVQKIIRYTNNLYSN
jgi:dihydroorotate dehydrogenase